MNILYEDNHLLVVEKPVNIPVQADLSGDADLLSMCKAYIKEKYGKPGEVYLGLVHRLDRPVGGVMVFARTSKAAGRLSKQFAAHNAQKRYVAIVDGDPPASAALSDYLLKDEKTFSSRVVAAETPGAKSARLSFDTLARKGGMALLDVQLDTGRAHQIRVQLMHAGYPIHGDMRYNPAAEIGTQIRLYAYALSLEHPTTGERMTFFCAPSDGDWKRFSAQIAVLPAFSVCRGVALTEELLAVDKNAGVEVEGELVSSLSTLFSPLYPVHRLDANTVGVVLFARTERMRERLLRQFETHAVQKTYLAVVCGVPDKEGRLVHYAVKDAASATVLLSKKGARGALEMRLSYRLLETDGVLSLVEIDLETGRTHQIRVQMAAIGHPVLGDDKYGDRDMNRKFRCRRQRLLSKSVTVDGTAYRSEREWTL